jgi:hypothetical protein
MAILVFCGMTADLIMIGYRVIYAEEAGKFIILPVRFAGDGGNVRR